jgi:predicted nucleotidyltransferase
MASPTPLDPEGASPRRVRECTDPSARLPALSVALVCRVTVDLAPVLEVGWVAGRDRRVIAIVGGTVTGDRLRGIVLPGESDVDLLVDFLARERGLLPLLTLAEQVEQIVGRPVDVAAVEVMAEPVRDRALAEAVPL